MEENTRSVAKGTFDKIRMAQPSQQKPGAIVQDDGRTTPKAIQRSSELALQPQTQSSRGRAASKEGHGVSAAAPGTAPAGTRAASPGG